MSAPGGGDAGDSVPAVLVIDDDPDHAAIALHVVARLSPQLPASAAQTPESGGAAIAAAPAGSLVLIDRHLGTADGLELLRAATRTRPDLRYLMLSAVVTAEERLAARHAGAVDAAEKPARLDGWAELLGGWLGRGAAGA